MLLIQLTFLFFTLPPTPPVALPLVVLTTSISVTTNTEISNSITLATPLAVGYSSWLGNWNSFNAILMTVPPAAGGGSSFPAASGGGHSAYSQ